MEELTDIEYLENFVLSNPELDKLENVFSEFNIFETLNLKHAEIRHSNVLAWLLNPNKNWATGFMTNCQNPQLSTVEDFSCKIFGQIA